MNGTRGRTWTGFPSLAPLCAVLLLLWSPAAAQQRLPVEREVARLDTVRSSADPAIAEIAAYGDAVLPHLMPLLESERRMTALGARWVLRELASDAAVFALMEHWSGLASTEERKGTESALRMVLERRSAVGSAAGGLTVDTPDTETAVDVDLEMLARACLCAAPGLAGTCSEMDFGTGVQALFAYGSGLTSGYRVSCGGRDVQVLPTDAFRRSELLLGRDFVRLELDRQELGRPTVPMARWRAARGAAPNSVALVRLTCGRVGRGEPASEHGSIWVRQGETWSLLASLFHMSVR